MRIVITDRLVARRALEGSTVPFTAHFFNDSTDAWSAVTPTTVRWRLDSVDTGAQVIDWTSETPGTSVAISIPGTSNTLNSCRDQEARELTVEADTGASQYRTRKRFYVTNAMSAAA